MPGPPEIAAYGEAPTGAHEERQIVNQRMITGRAGIKWSSVTPPDKLTRNVGTIVCNGVTSIVFNRRPSK